MTTQFHALRLDSNINSAVVFFSSRNNVDLNTVNDLRSAFGQIGIGEVSTGNTITVTECDDCVMVSCSSGGVSKGNIILDGVTL